MNKEYLKKLKEKVSKITLPGEIEKVMEHKTLYARFKEKALEIPNRVVLKYFGNNITYKQMLDMVDNMAKGFSKLGISYNDMVAVSLLGTPYGTIAFYALDKIGASMHMINCASGIDEVKRELTNIPCKALIANDLFCSEKNRMVFNECGIQKIVATSLTDGIPKGLNIPRIKYSIIEKLKGLKETEYDKQTIFNFNQIYELGKNSFFNINECEYSTNHIAAIAYTSGTNGLSKPCIASWERLDSMVQIMALTEEGRFCEGDVMFTTFPLWIFYSLLNMIHEPICLGVSIAFDPLFNPKDMVNRNNLYHFNHWLTMPSILKKAVCNNRKTDCSKWKIVLTGGGALPNKTKEMADDYIKQNNGTAKVNQGYGATELLGSFAYGYKENATAGSVGIPCVGNFIKVIDPDTKKEVGPNEVGVAYLYTPTRMLGYYGNEEATKESLIKDENGVEWYNSEDLVYVNEKNEIFLDDRFKKMVTTYDCNGNPTKLIPGRIKKAINNLRFVDECEIITIPNETKDNVAIAFITSKEKDEIALKGAVLKYCSENIPEYMMPYDVCLIDEIPLTVAKKVNYAELLKIYQDKYFNENVNKRVGNSKVKVR